MSIASCIPYAKTILLVKVSRQGFMGCDNPKCCFSAAGFA